MPIAHRTRWALPLPPHVRADGWGPPMSAVRPYVGADSQTSYAADVADLVSSISPSVKAEMSPGGRAALELTTRSLLASSGGNLSQLTDAGADAALRFATKILIEAATEAGLSALVSAGNAIPLLGSAISVVAAVADPAAQAHGIGYTAEEQKKYCSTAAPAGWFRSVREPGTGPSGPAGAVHVPADLLVHDAGTYKNGKRWVEPTELAWVLQLLTETTGVDTGGGYSDAKKAFGKYGLSKERRAIYEKLRRSIQATYKRYGTDGGATLWILYVDLLRADFDAGRLSSGLMQYLHILEGGAGSGETPLDASYWSGDLKHHYNVDTGLPGGAAKQAQDKRDIATILISDTSWSEGQGLGAAQKYAAEIIPDGRAHGICGLWTNAARQQVLDILQVWRQTLTPYYTQFESLEDISKRLADEYFGSSPGKESPLWSAAKIALALGVGGALGLYLLERPLFFSLLRRTASFATHLPQQAAQTVTRVIR